MDLKTGQYTSSQEHEALSETEKDRKSQKHKALQGNQRATTTILLAVFQQHHRSVRPRLRSTARAEENMVIH